MKKIDMTPKLDPTMPGYQLPTTYPERPKKKTQEEFRLENIVLDAQIKKLLEEALGKKQI